MKKNLNFLLFVLILVCFVMFSCNIDSPTSIVQEEDDPAFKVPPPPKYKITYFWVFNPEEELVDMNTQMVHMLDMNEQVIATVPGAVAERISMEGSGFLPADPLYVEPDNMASALLNLANDEGWPRSRFIEIDQEKFPWGMSSMGQALVPYWTVAVDPDVLQLGTIIYIPDYDGYVLPKGFTTKDGSPVHDGLFYCGDISWSFKGRQIDVFTGTYFNWQDTESRVSSMSRVPVLIDSLPPPFPPPDLDHSIPGDRIESEDYNPGGEGIGYHDSKTGNEGGVYRDDDVDIEYCVDTDGGFNVGWVADGEWLKYDAVTQADVTVNLDIRVACWSDAQTLHVEIDDMDVTGPMAVPNTGYWQNWTTITKGNIVVPAGTHTITVVFHGSGFNINWIQFTSGVQTPIPDPTETPFPTPDPTPDPTLTPGNNPGESIIMTFKDGKKAAYSPTYDDGLWASMATVWSIHRQYSITGTVCINTQDWVNNYPDKWADLISWLNSGYYRLGSHSHTHPHLPALPETETRYECRLSNEYLFTNTGYIPESLAWPYNDWDQPTADIVDDYFVCARDSDTYMLDTEPYLAGEPPDNPRFMALHAYVYGNKYKVSQMNAWIDDAITHGKWLTVNYHGVDHEGWGPVDSIKLTEHYVYVNSRSSDIWVEGMAEVGKYLKERLASRIILVSNQPSEIILVLTHTLAGLPVYNAAETALMYTVIYDYPLTVKLTVYPDWNTAHIQHQQGTRSENVSVQKDGGDTFILMNVVPNAGPITVTKIN